LQRNPRLVAKCNRRRSTGTDYVFTDTRARYGDIVIGPGSRADQRRVPDTAVQFAERATRRGRRGESA
jgi:hypothetical protein